MSDARSRLIVALDVPGRPEAMQAVECLAGHIGFFKLGLEIFVREGPALVSEIRERGEKVFLDLKLHDIPNTVAGAVRSACKLGVDMLTLHAAGGVKMLRAARESAESCPKPPLLLAVTALTSLSLEDVERIGIVDSLQSWVESLADVADEAGIAGLVASPLELSALRKRFGKTKQLVSPGIRPSGTKKEDQSRIATPRDAISNGADFLVVGRPILQAPDPASAADTIIHQIREALQNLEG